MFTRILVPTDFSGPSDAALAYARVLAGTFGPSLHLLHVVDNVFLRAVLADPRDQETAALGQLRDRLTAEDRTRLHALPVVERSDEPADEIVSYARTRDIDLIVMGTHGRSGMAHLLMGSVAEKVVRGAPCPVVTLHAAPPAPRKGHRSLTRILVPTDFSPPSDAALASARLLAGRFGASLHLLHVLEDATTPGSFGSEVYVADSPGVRSARIKDAQERLAHRVGSADRDDLRMTTEVMFGPTARTIVDYAADNGFDLIVMGTHGRRGMAHLLMGSVAENVVRTATCPVLSTHEARDRPSAPVKDRVAAGATA